jgi:hypothetical protein
MGPAPNRCGSGSRASDPGLNVPFIITKAGKSGWPNPQKRQDRLRPCQRIVHQIKTGLRFHSPFPAQESYAHQARAQEG